MNKEHKERWQKVVDALRSGNYKQSKHQLRTKSGFCCLGVACDVSCLGEWIGLKNHYSPNGARYNHNNHLDLPPEVANYYNTDTAAKVPKHIVRKVINKKAMNLYGKDFLQHMQNDTEPVISLAVLNDVGVPFGHIATIIEEHFIKRATK